MSIVIASNLRLPFRTFDLFAIARRELRTLRVAYVVERLERAERRRRLEMERAFHELDPRMLRDIGADAPPVLARLG